MKKVLIAIPTNVGIEAETFKSIYDLEVPEGMETDFQFFYGYRIDQVRNLIVSWARDYDYVFFVDSDIVLPSNALTSLYEELKYNNTVKVATGIYIQRREENIFELYKRNDLGGHVNIPANEMAHYIANDRLLTVSACGFGCALVDTGVFGATSYPWFDYRHAIDHVNTYSEDLYFCDKVYEAGYFIVAKTDVICEHIGKRKFVVPTPDKSHLDKIADKDLLPKDHVKYLKKLGREIEHPKVIYDIGACVGHWTRHAKDSFPKADIFLFDAAKSVVNHMMSMVDSRMARGCFNGLLSESRQQIMFYEDEENPGGNSYYKETTGHYDKIEPELREAYSLDDVVEANNWPLPDLIKMDIQGAELDVIKGAPKCMSHVKHVILEAQSMDYNEGAPKAHEVIEYMLDNGFILESKFCEGAADADYHFKRV